MRFETLPKDMQEDVMELASKHSITPYEALEMYLMGGEHHSEVLCKLKSAGTPDVLIQSINNTMWGDYNKEMLREINSL